MTNAPVVIQLELGQAEHLLRLLQSGLLDGSGIENIANLRRATIESILRQKREEEAFDVFLCHKSSDKPQVKRIGEKLKSWGVLPWLDEWELRPGVPWQRTLERHIKTIKSAAVFIGQDGRGPWQDLEIEAFIREFVGRSCPVIPVLLRSCSAVPELPAFLGGMHCVKISARNPDPIEQIVWGVTGLRPASRQPAPGDRA